MPSMREMTRDVWGNNLEEAFRDLRRLVDTYPYIAIDCEFPAVVARPIGKFKTSTDYHYQTMRCNVDILKLIQLAITLVDEDGNVALDCTWQFNFHFNTDEDTYEPSSIDALSKAGLDFARHRSQGIYPNEFAELMITSGLVLSDDVTWISYHGAYDFGYLLRTLTAAPLPLSEEEFFQVLKVWFPAIYDIKYIMRQIKPSLKGGLQDIAQDLGVQTPNILTSPSLATSGYASWLAATSFIRILSSYITPTSTRWDISSFSGALYGLGSTYVSGVLDNSRSTLTSAERERPGVNSTSNGINSGMVGSMNNGLGGMGNLGMGMQGGLVGVMSPNQSGMVAHGLNHQSSLGSLGSLGGITAHQGGGGLTHQGSGTQGQGHLPLPLGVGVGGTQHYTHLHGAGPAGLAGLGGVGLGGLATGMGSMGALGNLNVSMPLHHPHFNPSGQHPSHHHHPHSAHHLASQSSSTTSGTNTNNLSSSTSHAHSSSQQHSQHSTTSQQHSSQHSTSSQQQLYGLGPSGGNSYVPGYGLTGLPTPGLGTNNMGSGMGVGGTGMGVGGVGGIGGLGMGGVQYPGLNPYFNRDR